MLVEPRPEPLSAALTPLLDQHDVRLKSGKDASEGARVLERTGVPDVVGNDSNRVVVAFLDRLIDGARVAGLSGAVHVDPDQEPAVAALEVHAVGDLDAQVQLALVRGGDSAGGPIGEVAVDDNTCGSIRFSQRAKRPRTQQQQ